MARKRNWSKVITEHGVRVRLFERGGTIYRDVTLGRTVSENGKARTAHDIKSLGHSDRQLAETQAKALATIVAEARRTGVMPNTLTIGDVLYTLLDHWSPPFMRSFKGVGLKYRSRSMRRPPGPRTLSSSSRLK